MNKTFKTIANSRPFQIIATGILVSALFSGFWLGAQLILGTNTPVIFVSSNSMNVNSHLLNEWDISLFGMSLSIGDLVFVEGIEASGLNADYPDSDVVVFHNPDNPKEEVAYRIVTKQKIDGKWYFFVKGDGVGTTKWPVKVVVAQLAEWRNQNASLPPGAVSEDLIVGRVVLRVPLAGVLAVLAHDWFGVDDSFSAVVWPYVVVLFVLVVVVDFVVPSLRSRVQAVRQKRQVGFR